MLRTGNNKTVNFIGQNVKLGKNVKIWHFTYVGDKTKIGNNVTIGSLAHIDYNVIIGDNTRIEGCVYIPPHSFIGKNVFIGPSATFTNDPYPPSKRLIGVVIQDGAIIGARSAIKAGVKVGKNSVIAMGAVVVEDIPPNTVVLGIPAKPIYSRRTFEKKRRLWEKQGKSRSEPSHRSQPQSSLR